MVTLVLATVALVSVSGCRSKCISISAARAALRTTALNLNLQGRHQVNCKTRQEAARQVHPSLQDVFFFFFWITQATGPGLEPDIHAVLSTRAFTIQMIRNKASFVEGWIMCRVIWSHKYDEWGLLSKQAVCFWKKGFDFIQAWPSYGTLQAVYWGNLSRCLGEIAGMCTAHQGQTIHPYGSLGPFHLLGVIPVIK